MWRLWPHLRRVWAGTGAIVVGLTVTYVYSLLSEQALPHLRTVSKLSHDYWPWAAGAVLALGAASAVAERGYRRYEGRAPRALRTNSANGAGARTRRWLSLLGRGTAPMAPFPAPAAPAMVGRERELARLSGWFAEANSGNRRIIFVAGEPGIGKSTLTRAFLEALPNHGSMRIGRGQCVEQYGAGEPYMPILEALTRLCREPGSEKLVAILHRMAPAWLVQMPSLISEEDRARLQGLAQGTTQQRMLREMAEALEVIAAETPLVLFLEDLHWSDPSTLDLIATVARRTELARLMILGTYRPVEMLAEANPLRAMKEELELHSQCIELRLPLLTEPEVASYVARRFADRAATMAPTVYARSEGNPLFMVNVLDYLIEQGSLAGANNLDAPRNLRQMIERNLQRLSPDEQRILEAASVAGAEFSAAAVAAALEQPVPDIESCFARLFRREQFVSAVGTDIWPDGTRAGTYQFVHALYRAVLYDRTPTALRDVFHERIAAREENAWGGRKSEIATELAHHYRRSGNTQKALEYLREAGSRAVQRSANPEAVEHFRAALEILKDEPESPSRSDQELSLLLALGPPLYSTKGMGSAEVEQTYTRASELCAKAGRDAQLFPALYGIVGFYSFRAEWAKAEAAAQHGMRLAKEKDDHDLLIEAHHMMAWSQGWQGELQACRNSSERLEELYDFQRHSHHALQYGHDPAICIIGLKGVALWCLGYPEQALQAVRQMEKLAGRLGHAMSDCLWLLDAAWVHVTRGDNADALRNAEALKIVCDEQSFFLKGWASIFAGYTRSAEGSIEQAIDEMQLGIAELRANQTEIGLPLRSALLAEAFGKSGKIEEASRILEEGLAQAGKTGERLWEAELHRVKGELLLGCGATDEASVCFVNAIGVSQKQGARSFELRATHSLARLLASQGRRGEARAMLAEIYNWFTEGFGTKDLKDAKALLDELSTN